MQRFLMSFVFICGSFLVPFITHAEIIINEVAWMGTIDSQYEEWIELYNDGDDDVVLDGWNLYKIGGTKLASLVGTIESGEYFLVCRTTGSLPDPLGGACDLKIAFGGSGLNNTSDLLELKNAEQKVIDSVDGTDGWPAGDAKTKNSMGRVGDEWKTMVPSPGEINQGSSGDSDEENDGEESSENEDEGSGDESDSENSNNADTKKDPKEKIQKIEPNPVYSAHMIIPDFGTAGVPVEFKVDIKKDKILEPKRGKFQWFLGDGSYYEVFKNEPINHVFDYPGDYVVVLKYFSSPLKEHPDTIHRKMFVVIPDTVTIESITDRGGVVLKNNSTKEINIAQWSLVSGGNVFTFPEYTIIPKGKQMIVSSRTIGFFVADKVALMNQEGKFVSVFPRNEVAQAVSLDESEEFLEDGEVLGMVKEVPLPILPGQISEASNGGDQKDLVKANIFSIGESESWQELWAKWKWFFMGGGATILGILAYLAFRLYADESEL